MTQRGPQRFRGFHDDLERVRAALQTTSGTVAAEDQPMPSTTDTTASENNVTAIPVAAATQSANASNTSTALAATAPEATTPGDTLSDATATLPPAERPVGAKEAKDTTADPTPESTKPPRTKKVTTADNESDLALDGTIVSNKKIQKTTIWSALKQIFNGKKKTYQKKRADRAAAQPKTTAAEDRLDTIRAAAKQSSFAPGGDHDDLLRKIKARKQSGTDREAVSNITIKSKTSAPEPTWQHTIDDERTTHEPTVTAPTEPSGPVAESTPKTAPAPTNQPSAPTTPTADTTPAVSPPTTTTFTAPVVDQAVATENTPVTPDKLVTKAASSQPTPEPTLSATIETDQSTDSPSTSSDRGRSSRSFLQSNIFFYATIGVLCLVGGGLVGGSVWWWYQQDTPTTTSTPPPAVQQTLINATTNDTLSVTDRDTMLTALYNHQLTTSDVHAVTFITSDTVAATPQETLTALGLRFSGSFYRSVTDLTAGNWQGTDPYLVLTGTTFDSLFAGLLQWERTMSSDLAPLFGAPVTNSFDPTARTDNQIRAAFFADEIVANTSVRILRDELGETQLLYGFVNPTTVIITTSETAYQNLLPLIIR